MHFPKISDIATTDVLVVPRTTKLCDAMGTMFQSNHRNLIIRDENDFYLLSIYDVLRLKIEDSDGNLPLTAMDLPKIPTVNKEKNVLEALACLKSEFEQFIVVDMYGRLYGIVTQSDIISSIDPDTLMDNYRLADLLKIKKRDRWVSRDMITQDLLVFMERYGHDAALVVEEKRPVGIITTKDVLRLLKEHVNLSAPIGDYMTSPVETIPHDATLSEAIHFLQDKHFKRIVTVDDEGNLVGSITQKELISIAYTRWVRMIQHYQDELLSINQKLEEKSSKFERIASIDPLTGLYNRMKFLELYVSEYQVMVQRKNALSLILIDLDHFKKINDTYGHNMGDEVLRQISNLLLRELRSVDILCRWGGEEFVALLPAADMNDAEKIAEKIRSATESHSFAGVASVTMSIGVTQVHEHDELYDAIQRADEALYFAKVSGRNCVKTVQ